MPTTPNLTTAFDTHFTGQPTVTVRAPGRVNLIGEHTDYNDGFVLPIAIDRAVYLALRPTHDSIVTIRALDFNETARFDLTDFTHTGGWLEYIKGVAWALQQAGFALSGWQGVFTGDVPRGAGLSSSAALELAAARAFASVSPIPWEPVRMAQLAQKAENGWVGVNCGIMDQLISAAGVAGHALLIDCRTLDLTPVPLPTGTAVVVLDTTTRRGLVDSEYNTRRAQCQQAADFFGVPALRDVDLPTFEQRAADLPPEVRRRARHVITENARTLRAAEAMTHNDPATLGQLMNASHTSLRNDFEVSTPELDTIVALARQHPACYGARLTGAGFGGCAVALIQAHHAASFTAHLGPTYHAATGLTPQLYICHPADGAA